MIIIGLLQVFLLCSIFQVMTEDASLPPDLRLRARGAASNAAGRFEAHGVCYEPDGWDRDEEARVLRTQVSEERPRRIISYNRSPDLPFDRSVNPYRGCEHGCVYCFARPSHAYLGLSPGLDFETRIHYKPDAAPLLREALGRRGYRCHILALGANTDPYQPVERR